MKSFDEELTNAGDKLVVVMFMTSWCGPSKMVAPNFKVAAEEHKDLVFLEVNGPKSTDIAEKYDIVCYPTFVFIKNKEMKDHFSGTVMKRLQCLIEQLK